MRRSIGCASVLGLVLALLGCPDGAPQEGASLDVWSSPGDGISGPEADGSETGVATDGSAADAGGPGDVGSSPKGCESAADCADSLACTEDRCDGGVCAWAVLPEACLIGHVCYETGQSPDGAPCISCAPAADPLAWTAAPEGAACDPGDLCVVNAVCAKGVCGGTSKDCADGLPCTMDTCDSAAGCEHSPKPDGSPCVVVGEPCAESAACESGACVWSAPDCDDGNSCTADACDPGVGCAHVVTEGTVCDDGDPCTAGDLCDLKGICAGGDPATCDDQNACTIDYCEPGLGCANVPTETPCCVGIASVCDDGNACTVDTCDPVTQDCAYEPAEGACDDGLGCTENDACVGTVCGGQPVACDDGNPCTQDQCEEADGGGCLHIGVTGVPCDDGKACSTGDQCSDGVCVADTSGCLCDAGDGADALKLTALQLGTSGKPGQGLDVDQDPATCAPSSGCSEGVDNAFAPFAAFANPALESAVSQGQVVLVIEAPMEKAGAFDLVVHQAQPVGGDCDVQTQPCAYLVDAAGLDPVSCEPLYTLPAVLDGDLLSAGGADTQFPFELPLQEGISLPVTLFSVRLEMTVTLDGDNMVAGSGILAGAIRQDSLESAVNGLDDALLPDGISKGLILTILGALEYTIDTDGDGLGDAASVGFVLEGIDGVIVGVAQ